MQFQVHFNITHIRYINSLIQQLAYATASQEVSRSIAKSDQKVLVSFSYKKFLESGYNESQCPQIHWKLV